MQSSTSPCMSLSSARPLPKPLTSPIRPSSHGSSRTFATAVSSPSSPRTRSSSVRRYTTSTGRVVPSGMRTPMRSPSSTRSPSVPTTTPQPARHLLVLEVRDVLRPVRQHHDRRLAPPTGAAARSAESSIAHVTGSIGRDGGRPGGSSSSSARRAATAYAKPDGVRRLSSSTRNVPSRSRTTSKPMIAAGGAARRQAPEQVRLVALRLLDRLCRHDAGAHDLAARRRHRAGRR